MMILQLDGFHLATASDGVGIFELEAFTPFSTLI